MKFEITGEYIDLNKLLKAAALVESGGIAGEVIKAGEVLLDGVVETRKRKKVYPGSTVTIPQLGESVEVVSGN